MTREVSLSKSSVLESTPWGAVSSQHWWQIHGTTGLKGNLSCTLLLDPGLHYNPAIRWPWNRAQVKFYCTSEVQVMSLNIHFFVERKMIRGRTRCEHLDNGVWVGWLIIVLEWERLKNSRRTGKMTHRPTEWGRKLKDLALHISALQKAFTMRTH